MGGLGAPEIILILIVFCIFLIFPVLGYNQGKKRIVGPVAGLLLGLFLGVFGLIIVVCSPRITEQKDYGLPLHSAADELQKYKQLLDSGAITAAEYQSQKSRILNSN